MSDTRGNKRRASNSHPDEPVKKRGRPSKAVLATKVPEGSVSRRQAQAMLSRHLPLRYASAQEAAFYEDLVDRPAGHDWTEEDKAEADEEWDRSELKKASERLNTPQHASLFLLFKISLRLYRMTPIELFSPLGGMRYQAVSKNPQWNEWIMSGTFCDLLSALMVHPCWEENLDFLSLALKWTVTCRLDPFLAFSCHANVACSVLERILAKVKGSLNKRLSVSYHEMHKTERERASERGTPISTLSDILFKIGEAVPKETAKKPMVHPKYDTMFGYPVLPVTVWDLKVLTGVVDSMKFKPEWNYSAKEALSAWKLVIAGPESPAQERLTDIYMYTFKGIFRRLRLERRELDSAQRMEEADDQRPDPDSSSDDDEDQSRDGSSSSDDVEDQSHDASSSSDDEESQLEASSLQHQSRRPTIVYDSDDEESESTSRKTSGRSRRSLQAVVTVSSDAQRELVPTTTRLLRNLRHRDVVRGVEEEDDLQAGLDDFSVNLPGEREDDGMADNAFDFGEFVPLNTHESHEFRPHGRTLAESLPQGPPASPIYTSVRETKMLEELALLREENKELRDGQKRLQDLFAQGVKKQNDVIAQKDREIVRLLKEQSDLIRKGQDEQKQQMLDMKNEQKKQMRDLMKEMESMKSELTQSRQAKEAPNQGDSVQSRRKRPGPPKATVIVTGAATRSPELGTNPSVPSNDVTVMQETMDVEPIEEDIAPQQPVPKQKTPEPERSEQQVTTAPEVIQSAPEQNTAKQKTPEPEMSQQRSEIVQEQHHEHLSDQSRQALGSRASVKVSSKNLTKDSLRGLPKRPVKKERRIGSMTGLLSGQTSSGSIQRKVFKTPRSEILRMIKNIE
ncbi:hypothetical protein BFJ72_g2789 [Fusarium proliferatum]|uniref:Uncharacterized protein n=1 Tax=Gibberella intermedia TaxID=948311 RepID=A0A420TZX5_GIBIN|nr:hypothetical protein BFJ72_g2789 [Fusarium proliferatum]